ncbi:MAG: calcium-binding protein [Pseudomonadota bacterium]
MAFEYFPTLSLTSSGQAMLAYLSQDEFSIGSADLTELKLEFWDANTETRAQATTVTIDEVDADIISVRGTALSDGKTVVVWREGALGTDFVYAQVFDGATPSGNRIDVGSTSALTSNTDMAVEALPDGRFVVTFADRSFNGTSVIDTAVSVVVSPPFKSGELPAGGTFEGVSLDSTALGDGWVTVWASDTPEAGQTHGVFATIQPRTGTATTDIRVSPTTYDEPADHPAVTVLSDGAFAVLYEVDGHPDARFSPDEALILRIFEADGTPRTDEIVVQDINRNPLGYRAELVALPDGNVTVIWVQETPTFPGWEQQVLYSTHNGTTGGAVDSGAVALATPYSSYFHLQAAAMPDGSVTVMWGQRLHGDTEVTVVTTNPITFTGAGAVTVTGDDTDETLVGTPEDDTLDGGAGDDDLEGGEGSDTYVFDADHGLDRIEDDGGDNDVVQLDHIADIKDLDVWRDALPGATWEGTLYIETGDDDEIEVANQFASHGRHFVETLRLSTGAEYVIQPGFTGQTTDDLIVGRSTNDFLRGGDGDDALFGGDGNDALFGQAGDDVLVGGNGFDTLRGGIGADCYVVTSDGQGDTIIDFDGTADLTSVDQLVLVDVDSLDDISIFRGSVGNSIWEGNLLFQFGALDNVLIRNHFATNGRHAVEELVLSNGDTFNLAHLSTGTAETDLIVGRTAIDHLTGLAGDDVLIGSQGDDVLRGGAGGDRYVMGSGDGDDTIIDYDGTTDLGSDDVIVFKDIDDIDDLTLSRVAEGGSSWAGTLLIETAMDSVRVQHHFASNGKYKIEQIELSDGTTFYIDDFMIL